MDRSAIPSAASTCINVTEDGSCRYIAERDRKVGALLHPDVGCGSKLPNRVRHGSVNPESAQNIELAIEDGKATGQSYAGGVTWPGSGNAFNHVGERVITKHAISGRGLAACRAAYTVDVRRA